MHDIRISILLKIGKKKEESKMLRLNVYDQELDIPHARYNILFLKKQNEFFFVREEQ